MPVRQDARDPLLHSLFRRNRRNERSDEPGCCKSTTIILVVLFVCGLLAFGISAVVFRHWEDIPPYFKELLELLETTTVIPTTTTTSTIPTTTMTSTIPITTTTSTTTTMTTTIAQATTTKPPVCEKRIIGYYTSFESTDITKNQLSKLTHAVFAYIQMDSDGTLQHIDGELKERFLSMKNKAKSFNVKLMISIGGPDNSGYFSQVIQDSEKKSIFIQSIVNFLKNYHLDGVDLFWKWVGAHERYQFATFLEQLRQKLREQEKEDGKEYILSIVVPPPGIENWEAGYDLDEILDYVDFVNVYSMDYAGPWTNQWGTPTGPIAHLYTGVGPRKNFNVDWTMDYYVCKTRQPNKFNIVIPFFARLWKNVKDAIEPGKEVFRNAEIHNNRAEGNPYMSRWTVKNEGWKLSPATWDEASKSSYIFKAEARTFLTFETEKSIAAKTNYVNEMNLGGVWIWSVDMDDDRNSLLNTIFSSDFCVANSKNTVEYAC